MIADFASPIAPAGWLELDGTVISTATYSGLFAVMSISSTGTRTNGSPIITSIPSTTHMRAGYYVFGTGINTGLTILTIDSPTQITLSGNASSSGTSAISVSPWLMNTGTVKLPDLTTAGRFRRSRTSATKVGDVQADQNKAHTHSGTTAGNNVNHTHSYSGTTGSMNNNASHTHSSNAALQNGSSTPGGGFPTTTGGAATINSTNTDHQHAFSGVTTVESVGHTHTYTTSSDGGTEVRPLGMVVLTCIKT